jgi:hypothetical protein
MITLPSGVRGRLAWGPTDIRKGRKRTVGELLDWKQRTSGCDAGIDDMADMMILLCQQAGLLPEESPIVKGIGVVPTVTGARKIAALMQEEKRAAFLDGAAEIALLLTDINGHQLS